MARMAPWRSMSAACLMRRGWGLSGWASKRRTMVCVVGGRSSGQLYALAQQFPYRRQLARQVGQVAQIGVRFLGAVEVAAARCGQAEFARHVGDRKSTRLNSSHPVISYAVFCLKK